MRNYKRIQQVFGALTLASLVACGGNDGAIPVGDPRYSQFASACGVSQNFANSPYMQTVKGTDPSGATLDLLLYGDGSGNISAVGQLTVPDMSRIAMGTGSFQSCVTGTGRFDMNTTDPDLLINLQGNGVQLQPKMDYPPFVRGSVLKGNFSFQFANVPFSGGGNNYFSF